ncbi:MAG: sugar ABC transporter permease YjfF [Phycisphaeraceae bacterium]|nr:MAG: sugar ABC transporter permease YjfF [Phycisphaeraceae bacterium]
MKLPFRLSIGRQHIPILATLAVLILVFAFGAIRHGDRNFASLYNIVSLFRGGAVIGIAAIGSTFIILSKGIDLSVGAVIALTTTIIAVLVSPQLGPGWHPAVVIPIALVIGTLFGTAQGCLIHFFELPPFLVTLAGMFLARGLAFSVHPQNIAIEHDAFHAMQSIGIPLGRSDVPLAVIVLLVFYAIAMFVSRYTNFGREVYTIGGDEPSARLMGVNIGRVKIGVYALGGLTAALAGVIATIDRGDGSPSEFVGYELDAIAAVVIGGTLLTGGVGFMIGTLLGVLILGLIRLIIDNEGTLSSWWTNISAGALLFGFILLQTVLVRLAKRSG